MLQIRAGLELIENDLTALRRHLAALARRWRDTPMAGRTHLQHALPITFGYKCAVLLPGFQRGRDSGRLQCWRRERLRCVFSDGYAMAQRRYCRVIQR